MLATRVRCPTWLSTPYVEYASTHGASTAPQSSCSRGRTNSFTPGGRPTRALRTEGRGAALSRSESEHQGGHAAITNAAAGASRAPHRCMWSLGAVIVPPQARVGATGASVAPASAQQCCPPAARWRAAGAAQSRPHAGPVSSTPRAPVPAAVHELLVLRLRCCGRRERHGCCSTLGDARRACRAVAGPDHKRARSADLRQHVICACPRGARPAAAPRATPLYPAQSSSPY